MKSFPTGSYVYGLPTEESDIDIVVMMEDGDADDFDRFCGEAGLDNHGDVDYPGGLSYKSGKFNMIVVDNDQDWQVWKDGTEECIEAMVKNRGGLERSAACEIFTKHRAKAGLGDGLGGLVEVGL